MADNDLPAKLFEVSSAQVRKCKVKYGSKQKRNRNRKLRRKRNKLKYIRKIRNSRTERESQSIRGALSVFNITDMEDTHRRSVQPPREVAEWQNQHQLAYWKSRAISLEYENRMLYAHIRKMCSQEIQDYVDYVKNGEQREHIADDENDCVSELETTETSDRMGEDAESAGADKKLLYGEKESKISAMETAMKVNYNLQLERHKPQMWPNIPLNL